MIVTQQIVTATAVKIFLAFRILYTPNVRIEIFTKIHSVCVKNHKYHAILAAFLKNIPSFFFLIFLNILKVNSPPNTSLKYAIT